MPEGSKLSRRSFLIGSVAVGAGVATAGALAACQPAAAPSPTAAPQPAAKEAAAAPTVAPASKGGVTVRVLTAEFFYEPMILPATAIFNEQNQGRAFVKAEVAPEGWVTKALQMVRDKQVIWEAYAVDSFFNLYQRIKTGMAQPLDPYIKASAIPWAKDFKDKYIAPVVYDSGVYEGKFYMMPTKLNMAITPYNVNMVKGVGYETIPETWDEVRVMLRKIQDKYGKEDVWACHVDLDLWRTVGGIYCSLTNDKPYDEEGMVKLDSPEWSDALDLMKSFYTDKLANPAFLGSPDGQTTWQKGKIAVIWNYPSWLHLAQTAWGSQTYDAANMSRPKKGGPNRTWVHVDGTYLIANAPHPQETTDWMLTMLGPEGPASDAYTRGMISRSGSPMYKSHIESPIVKGNAEYPWLYGTYKMMEQSFTAPLSPLHFLVDAKGKKYLPPYFKGEISAKEAIAKMKDEIQKDKSKMLSAEG